MNHVRQIWNWKTILSADSMVKANRYFIEHLSKEFSEHQVCGKSIVDPRAGRPKSKNQDPHDDQLTIGREKSKSDHVHGVDWDLDSVCAQLFTHISELGIG